MSKVDTYKEKYTAKLDEWKAEIDKLKAQAKQEKSDASLSAHDRIDELEKKREEIKQRIEKLSDASNDAWDDVKSGIENACTELSGSIQAAAHKLKS